jgi:pimeloyl-ACP methyl ester carboxylesterase
MRSYRGMRLLAMRLAEVGFDVLRFDYSGTGDSEGASLDARLEHWQRDISYAAQELRSLADKPRLALLGLRLGALIAHSALQSKQVRAQHLISWDAPPSGADFVAQMHRHGHLQDTFKNAGRSRSSQLLPHEPNELCGHAWPKPLAEAITALTGLADAAHHIAIQSADHSCALAEGTARIGLAESSCWQHYRWLGSPWIPAGSVDPVVAALSKALP